jgi:hypothetical protein
MPAASKYTIGYGFLAKLEASYNAGGSLSTSTDGVLLEELMKFKPDYANNGARPMPPGTSGYQKRVAPSGRFVPFPAKVAPKGAGAAYSSSVTPNIHALLRACGMTATGSFTGGSEKWEYAPDIITATPASLVGSIYGRGQLYPVQGILGDFTYSFKAGEVPVVDFAFKGLMPSAITDVSLPTITYPALSIDPPKAVNTTLTFAGVSTHIVRELTLKWGRPLNPRLDANVGGHAGFGFGPRTTTLDVTIETPALSVFDPHNVFDQGFSVGNWSFAVGTVQYNRYSMFGNAAQLTAPPEEDEDGKVSLTKLSMQLNPSALNASDDVTWRFN